MYILIKLFIFFKFFSQFFFLFFLPIDLLYISIKSSTESIAVIYRITKLGVTCVSWNLKWASATSPTNQTTPAGRSTWRNTIWSRGRWSAKTVPWSSACTTSISACESGRDVGEILVQSVFKSREPARAATRDGCVRNSKKKITAFRIIRNATAREQMQRKTRLRFAQWRLGLTFKPVAVWNNGCCEERVVFKRRDSEISAAFRSAKMLRFSCADVSNQNCLEERKKTDFVSRLECNQRLSSTSKTRPRNPRL